VTITAAIHAARATAAGGAEHHRDLIAGCVYAAVIAFVLMVVAWL